MVVFTQAETGEARTTLALALAWLAWLAQRQAWPDRGGRSTTTRRSFPKTIIVVVDHHHHHYYYHQHHHSPFVHKPHVHTHTLTMAFRVAARRFPTALAASRPAPIAPATALRAFSSTPRSLAEKPSPEAKASSVIDSLPGNSLVSKAGTVLLGTGVSAVAISQELYVANEETVILAGFLIFATLVGRAVAKPTAEWADGHIEVSWGCTA